MSCILGNTSHINFVIIPKWDGSEYMRSAFSPLNPDQSLKRPTDTQTERYIYIEREVGEENE